MRILILLLGFLMMQSCVQEEELKAPEESKVDLRYKYSKKVDVFDTEGNSAVVKIWSNDIDEVNDITADDLELKVTRKYFTQSNSNENEETVYYNEDTQVKRDYSNYVFVDVIATDLKEDITGYFVQVKTIPDIGTRGGKYKKFSYGSSGTRGAGVEFISEDRGSCKLEIDLDKLATTNSIWYSEMADAKLKDPGNYFSHINTTQYYKYRLTVDINGWRCGTYDVDWTWWWIQ